MPLNTPQYHHLLTDLKARIREAQYEALKAVNRQQLGLYWYIGGQIVKKQAELGWGKSVVEQLSSDIQAEFPGITGFSARNLWLMRQWYETYVANEKLQPMVAEIGWTHNIQIMSKCKDDFQREFDPLVAQKTKSSIHENWQQYLPSLEQLIKHSQLIKALRPNDGDSA